MNKAISIFLAGAAILVVALALIAYFKKKPKTSVTSTVGGIPVPPEAANPPSGSIAGPPLDPNLGNVPPCPIGTHLDVVTVDDVANPDFAKNWSGKLNLGDLVCKVN